MILAGQSIGRYQLIEMLGHGGMGQVWKAMDPHRKDEHNTGFVVLKFLPDALRLNPDATEDFKSAYRRVQTLHHEHICPLHDIGEEPGLGCFQVMQFLEGITLRTLIRQEDPQRNGLPIGRVLSLLTPVSKALDYAHRNKLIHRDIKPENIIFDPATEEVHLIDFGLAAQVRTSMSKYSQQRMSTSGTEAYMSPEQWQGHLQEAASDQWALAVVAWELLTGSLPFHGDGMQLGFAVCQSELSMLPERLQHLQPVFLKGMAKDRKQRYSSCVEFLKSLVDAKPAAPTIIIPQKPALLGFPASETQVKEIQQQWSKYLNIPVITQHRCGEMVLIPPGEFLMGSSQSPEELARLFAKFDAKVEWFQDETQHRVKITKPFLLGKSAVTVGAFRDFVTASGYLTEAEKDGKGGEGYNAAKNAFERDAKYGWNNTGWQQSPQHPVVNVTWNDAVAFVEHQTKHSRSQISQFARYALSTEAQWEYSCRAGTGALFYNGNDPEGLAKIGNVADGTKRKKWSHWKTIDAEGGHLFTAPVGQFRPNAFGLYDMLGNVFEWCQDWYGRYETGPATDPTGPSSGSSRVLRGGSWSCLANDCRSARRDRLEPSYRDSNVGFRVLCELS
ncbi:MAG: SUMF1/EgtB/PvdO family nonheme iron enzyme [Planctomycetaceae bacterium]|nr:SUMF1/EgtB/PvdO family nonheme iron enzyme [Planctomycetaceae bacterium]